MTGEQEQRRGNQGRPAATTHAAIERAAFTLFAQNGFDGTTLDDIAAAVGVGKRTLFRYYASKNDIPWGQFDRTLENFEQILAQMPDDLPLWQAIHHGVIAFNDFPSEARPSHRDRMHLILSTPALQAHSVLRYGQWRAVIARFVAERRGLAENDLLPQTVGHVSLALALSAYQVWLEDESLALGSLIEQSMGELRGYLADR